MWENDVLKSQSASTDDLLASFSNCVRFRQSLMILLSPFKMRAQILTDPLFPKDFFDRFKDISEIYTNQKFKI